MQLDTVYEEARTRWGKPLAGLTILAAEHMQALPFGTQLLAMLGADVIKVEPPGGEAGRAALPTVPLPDGSTVGGTFARNNLNKSSIVLDLKNPDGKATFLRLAERADVVAENMRPGVMERLGLGYDDVAAVVPGIIYVSVSGFGNRTPSPYKSWPAYAPVAESMAGLYELGRRPDEPLRTGIAGALADNVAALYATIGILTALRHRDVSGVGQHVDISMLDAMIATNDLYPQLWSLGLPASTATGRGTGIMATFRAADGEFLISVIREHQLARLATLVGRPEWVDDPRLADRADWSDHVEDMIRPEIEAWAVTLTRLSAATEMAKAGIPSGPCFTMDDISRDEHVLAHNMMVELPSGTERPVLMPGNPIKMSRTAEGPLHIYPSPGQHTQQILSRLLDAHRLADWLTGALGTLPPASKVAVVHGDYQLDNLIIDPVGPGVRAILDWEMSRHACRGQADNEPINAARGIVCRDRCLIRGGGHGGLIRPDHSAAGGAIRRRRAARASPARPAGGGVRILRRRVGRGQPDV